MPPNTSLPSSPRMSPTGRATGVVFLSGVRTGFGSFGGALKDLSATDLGALAGAEALARSGVSLADVDHVVFGNVLQTSADAPYLARHVGLRVGLPVETPAVTVNRLCGSGFEAVVQAAQQILLGESGVVLAGGTESMSQAPHVVRGARWGLRLGPPAPLEDSLWEALRDAHCGLSMAETAETLGQQYRIGREAVDCYAAMSQARAREAWARGDYGDEVIPVLLQDRKAREPRPWAADEHMRPDTTPEALAKLPSYFKKDGVVTAGNASGICDGAAALVVASERLADERGLAPMGRLLAWAAAGVDPRTMGLGPVPAARRALERAGLALDDMDLIEINEAFAVQYLAVERELGLERERTNVDGGAVALGHPLGASGARITLHLLHALRRRGGRYGLGAACIGGGQGIAVVVEAS
jgi:acetyl-CoA acyltransferase 2